MGFFRGATRVVKRIGAFILGAILTPLGAFLVYESFVTADETRIFSKVAWFVLVFGLGALLYSFSDDKKKEETAGTGPAAEENKDISTG